MLVGVGDEGEPGLTPVPSSAPQDSIPYRDTHTGKNTNTQLQYSLYWILLRLVYWKHTVNIEGILMGNQHSAYDKPPSSPKNVHTVLQP